MSKVKALPNFNIRSDGGITVRDSEKIRQILSRFKDKTTTREVGIALGEMGSVLQNSPKCSSTVLKVAEMLSKLEEKTAVKAIRQLTDIALITNSPSLVIEASRRKDLEKDTFVMSFLKAKDFFAKS